MNVCRLSASVITIAVTVGMLYATVGTICSITSAGMVVGYFVTNTTIAMSVRIFRTIIIRGLYSPCRVTVVSIPSPADINISSPLPIIIIIYPANLAILGI